MVVHLNVEVLRAIVGAQQMEYRLETREVTRQGRSLDDEGTFYEGVLGRDNVINFREMLTLSGVDPWAAVPEEDRPAETVGSPPPK